MTCPGVASSSIRTLKMRETLLRGALLSAGRVTSTNRRTLPYRWVAMPTWMGMQLYNPWGEKEGKGGEVIRDGGQLFWQWEGRTGSKGTWNASAGFRSLCVWEGALAYICQLGKGVHLLAQYITSATCRSQYNVNKIQWAKISWINIGTLHFTVSSPVVRSCPFKEFAFM